MKYDPIPPTAALGAALLLVMLAALAVGYAIETAEPAPIYAPGGGL